MGKLEIRTLVQVDKVGLRGIITGREFLIYDTPHVKVQPTLRKTGDGWLPIPDFTMASYEQYIPVEDISKPEID